MNVLALEAIISIVIAFAVGGGGYYAGHKNGSNAQKAEDQAQFDKINGERAAQKADANALLQKIEAGIIEQQRSWADQNLRLEKQSAELNKANDDLRAALSTHGLRFTIPALKGGADRTCSPGANGPKTSAPGTPSPTLIQLPDSIAGNLRQLVFDADQLNVQYRKCYQYATGEVNEK